MPSREAAFCSRILRSRMYRCNIATDLWPLCFIICRSLALFIAACVIEPARRLCPAMDLASIPARAAARLMIRPIESGWRPRAKTLPFLETGRRRKPILIPVELNQCSRTRTGHVARFPQRGIPTFLPSPSWSVFDRGRSMTNPSLYMVRS